MISRTVPRIARRTFGTSAAPVDGLFIGSTGVVHNSSEVQWKFFNQVIKEKYPELGNGPEGVGPWSKQVYTDSLKQTNGRSRMKTFLESKGVQVTDDEIEALYLKKTGIWVDYIKANGFAIRPGVKELVKEAKARGLKTAMVSCCLAPEILEIHTEQLDLDLVVSGHDAPRYEGKLKPAGNVYLYAKHRLNLTNPVAIEDTQISGEAPTNAGIPWIASPNAWVKDHDFKNAAMRVEDCNEITMDCITKVAAGQKMKGN